MPGTAAISRNNENPIHNPLEDFFEDRESENRTWSFWIVDGGEEEGRAEAEGDAMKQSDGTGKSGGESKENRTASRDSVGIYLRDIRRYPLLNREEEARVAWRVKSGDEEARNELISRNLRLVIRVGSQ